MRLMFSFLVAAAGCATTDEADPVDRDTVEEDAVEEDATSQESTLSTPGGGSVTEDVAVVHPPTDIVLVVDNSCSMVATQASLAAVGPELFGALEGLDFHVGIITSDPSGDGKLEVVDGARYVVDSDLAPELWWADAVQVGNGGPPDQVGVGALYQHVLEYGDQANPDSTFHRPGAHFVGVVVSDADDETDPGLATVGELEALLGDLAAERASVTVHAVVPTSGPDAAVTYLDLAAATGGSAANVAGPLAPPLVAIASAQAQGATACASVPTKPGTLEVEGSLDEGADYVVDGDCVELLVAVAPGTVLTLRYEPA